MPTPPLGGGGWIAFSARINGNWDIYALRVDGAEESPGGMIRLTAHPAEDRFPAFSPDGRALAFASRRDGFWNLYTLTPDGTITQLTDDPAYDGAPAWSPDGKRIAFDSMRDGNLDVWVMDAGVAVERSAPKNLTADSPAGDCDPAWSPDGRQIAFTSWRYEDKDIFAVDLETGQLTQLTSSPTEEHLASWRPDGEVLYTVAKRERQQIYRRTVGIAPDVAGRQLTPWLYVDAPVRSPDGVYLTYLYRRTHGASLYVQRPEVKADLPVRLSGELPIAGPLSWTETVAPWVEAQGDPVVLYEERTAPGEDAPYDLKRLEGVTTGNPWLSDRVDDSFQAMRQRVVDETGHDFLAELSDAWRGVGYDGSGSAYMSWHKAGRAIDTLLDYLSPDRRQRWLEVALEAGGGEVYWRLYLRCQVQDGSQGMPLKVRPWDLTADARRNLTGGRYKPVPNGYYVDLTDVMAQYGWQRIAAHDGPDFHWHTNFLALEYWHFQKTDGLLWYEAMSELFPPDELETYHRWEVQVEKGTPIWLAAAKGVPLPWEERHRLEMLVQ
jgi:TolB protein